MTHTLHLPILFSRQGLLFLLLLAAFSKTAFPGTYDQDTDRTATPHKADSLRKWGAEFAIRYRSVPSLARGMDRYVFHADFSNQGRSALINYPVQEFWDEQPSQLSITEFARLISVREVKDELYKSLEAWLKNTITEKELLWASWRNQMVRIGTEEDLNRVMTEGTNAMMGLGYNDLARDMLPFVSMLMEEQRYYHFDHSRIAIFGKGVPGIVTPFDFMAALKSMDPGVQSGVCRDIQEAGLRFLRPLCKSYYDTHYPDLGINPDDYLFLQSWVTNSGQHVTTTLIDPLDRERQYELDWGKVIVKTRQEGYDNGRQYGTIYRIWKYNSDKGYTVPVDARRTQTGRLLDELMLTRDEKRSFVGLASPDLSSDLRVQWRKSERRSFGIVAGFLEQEQKFLAGIWQFSGKEREKSGWIRYRGKLVVQMLLLEDHIRRNAYLPKEDNSFAGTLLLQPRYLANIRTKPLLRWKSFQVEACIDGMVEALWLANRSNGSGDRHIQKSGDAGLYITQGIQLTRVKELARLHPYLKIQNRSFLVAKEVRYMAPNPFVFFPKSRFASPALDLVTGLHALLKPTIRIRGEALLEYSNMGCLFLEAVIDASGKISPGIEFSFSSGFNHQLKGPLYYWYPANRLWITPGLRLPRQGISLSANLQSFDDSEVSFGFSIFYHLGH